LRALILHNTLNSVGGGERVCLAVIEALKNAGWKVILATVEPTDWGRVERIVGRVVKPDVETSLLPFKVRMFGIYMRLLTYYFAWKVGKNCDLIINTHGDVLPIESHITYMHFPTFTLLKEQPVNIKYSQKWYWRAYFTPFEKIQGILVKRYLRKGLVLTNSRYSAKAIKKYTGRDATVIYPPVDVKSFLCEEDAGREDLVVSCGRYSPEKNYEFLLEVAERLEDVKFIVIGASSGKVSSSYYRKLAEIKRKKSLKNVQLLRDIPFKQQLEIYRKAKVYMHCMIGEHFGMAVVEAMASGLIPVVHKSGGVWEDIVECGKYGYGYENLDEAVRKIGEALSKANNLRKEIIKSSRRFTKQKFIKSFSDLLIRLGGWRE